MKKKKPMGEHRLTSTITKERSEKSTREQRERLKHAEHTTAHRYIPRSMHACSSIEVAMYKQQMQDHLFMWRCVFFFFNIHSAILSLGFSRCGCQSRTKREEKIPKLGDCLKLAYGWTNTQYRSHCLLENLLFNYDVILLCRCVWDMLRCIPTVSAAIQT